MRVCILEHGAGKRVEELEIAERDLPPPLVLAIRKGPVFRPRQGHWVMLPEHATEHLSSIEDSEGFRLEGLPEKPLLYPADARIKAALKSAPDDLRAKGEKVEKRAR